MDIDGVLVTNTLRNLYNGMKAMGLEPKDETQFKPEAINNLNELVSESGAKVVIISMWRRTMGVEKIKSMLVNAGFKHGDMILNTEHFAGEILKADEVEFFLNKMDDFENYVIIDDCGTYSEWQQLHLISPNAETGLTYLEKEKAIKLLKRKMI